MIIGFNMLLLPIYGIVGAGIAFFISFFIYFLIRLIFIKIKYKLQPYNYKFFLIILFGITSYSLTSFIPEIHSFWVDLFIRSFCILTLYLTPIICFKIYPELNVLLKKYYLKLKK